MERRENNGTERKIELHGIFFLNNCINTKMPTLNQRLLGAAKREDIEECRDLLDRGADVNAKNRYDGSTPLHRASWTGNYELCKLLLDRGADVNATDNLDSTPLHLIFTRNRATELNVFNLLLDRGANINAKDNNGRTPLHIATWWERTEFCKLLLDYGADVIADRKNKLPIDIAKEFRHTEMIELFNSHINVLHIFSRRRDLISLAIVED